MAELTSLSEAVAALVHDGDSVALEGFTHLIPFAAGHELLRQGRRELELIRMTPDILYDQMIGMGAARKLVFSYGGNPGVGSLHRFRDAIENGWPRPLELEEHSHAGMANRFVAGASRPALRGHARLSRHRPRGAHDLSRPIDVPVHGRAPGGGPGAGARMSRSSTPRRPTGDGNVQLWGIPGVQKEAVLAARALAGHGRADRRCARAAAGLAS